MNEREAVDRREQLHALIRVAKYRPKFAATIFFAGIASALLEGVGLGFIMPIVEIIQSTGDPAQQADGVMAAFVSVYDFLAIPFTLGYVIIGVALILTVRWTLTFFVRWFRGALEVDYTREVQARAFEYALDARIEYFDKEGTDDILNAIVTQAEYAGKVITQVVTFFEQGFLILIYLAVAMAIAPMLTFFAIVLLGGFTLLFQRILEPGYDLGEEVADANENIQQTAQSGVQGIRDTKLFGLKNELYNNFLDAVDQFAAAGIRQQRNRQAINSYYSLLTAISVFVFIYVAIEFADLSLGSLGVFLFAMFRIGPKASSLNTTLYRIENDLPHLVRTHAFIDELKQNNEPENNSIPVPDCIHTVEFDDVHFSYRGQEENALSGLSLKIERSEFVGFVGQSGAGKSTIVSLLVRMYDPDSGEIRANGHDIHKMNLDRWRGQIAVVRQDPFIFNDTLRYNLTIGNRDASQQELTRVCRIAKVDEFLDEMPAKYDTQLGDDGIRLSGGQRQRVALARALLKDTEILVLDEATSDLDSSIEKEVQQSIEGMNGKYTIISIAHRLSSVESADRIYTIEDGNITEFGRHEELLNESGQYAELYNIQSKS
jgi:subfamily B ATP-binding cassette protein MsbA